MYKTSQHRKFGEPGHIQHEPTVSVLHLQQRDTKEKTEKEKTKKSNGTQVYVEKENVQVS